MLRTLFRFLFGTQFNTNQFLGWTVLALHGYPHAVKAKRPQNNYRLR